MGENVPISGPTHEQVRAIFERAIEKKIPKKKKKTADGDLPIVPFDVQLANEIRIHEQKLKEAEKKNPNTP